MFNSDEAATLKTGLSGWFSRNGRFYGGDERAARYDGCTHVACEDCGEPTERGWLVCPKCKEIRDIKRYDAMPKVEWDGKGGLYSESCDRYFWSWDEVENYCEEEDTEISQLRLVICEPQYLHLIDPDDFCDELAEDGELPDTIIKAIDDFNKVIKDEPPVSWYPGKKAVLLK